MDYIEEDVLIYANIEQPSVLDLQNAKYLMIIPSDKKFLLQINNSIFFEGEFDYSMGTHVFFKKDADASIDPLYSHSIENEFKFHSKTNKMLCMNRIMLKDITEKDEIPENEIKLDNLKISRTYEEALNLFLTPKRNAPRIINESEETALLEIIKAQKEAQEDDQEMNALNDDQNNLPS